jgi:hypothetical protein
VAGLIAVAVIIAALWLKHRAHPDDLASITVAVLPMDVQAGPESAWLRLGAMDLVAERLRAAGLGVAPSESVVALLQSAHGNDPVAARDAIRYAMPDALVVSGRIIENGEHWNVHLDAQFADATTLDVDAGDNKVLEAARAAADALLGRLGRANPPQARLAPGAGQRLQQARAALLANDLDSARAILIGDPVLARSEPQLGYQLVRVDFRAGRYAEAETAVTALLAEPAARDPLFHARLLDARGALRIRRDNYAGAGQDFDAAVHLLDRGTHGAELGQALTGRGVARAEQHDFAGGLADLGAARVQLAGAGDDLAIARVDADLGALEMYRDRSRAALGYLDSAAREFELYGAINELLETLYSMVSAQLALLEPHAALGASDRSWALRERATDPTQRLNLTLDRVDVMLSLGRLHDAGKLLDALPPEAPPSNPYSARRLHALRARRALAAGDAAGAVVEARHALALAPAGDGGEQQAWIARLYQRAELAVTPMAPDAAPAVRWFPASVTFATQPLAEAEWAVHQGRTAAAERYYGQAVNLAERRGVPAVIAEVAESYGSWLLAEGRSDRASAVIGRVSPWAARDFGCALLQVELYRSLGKAGPWARALAQARALAGERDLPPALRQPPATS